MSYFNDMCLICLKNSNDIVLIGTSIENKLKYFLPELELKSNTSKYICAKCKNNLSICHEFKQKCLQNITIYEKYAQQITTTNNFVSCGFVCEQEDENNYESHILEPNSEINIDMVNSDALIIKEEINEELVLNDELKSVLHDIKIEKSELDDTSNINQTEIDLKHKTEKLYKCEVCNRSFKYLNSLMRHQLIHSNKKPYACKICNKSFRQLQALKDHHLIHTGEKPHTCEVCNDSFRQMNHLQRHYLTHTGEKPYSCEVCNKAFTQLSSLKDHKLIHTGERPYSCEVCNKSFRRQYYLNQHKFLHSN